MRTLPAAALAVLFTFASACSDDDNGQPDAAPADATTIDAKPQIDTAVADAVVPDALACNVVCPPNTTCEGSSCYPVCSPACAPDEYCKTDFTCGKWSGDGGRPRPTVPPLSVPDGGSGG